MAQRGNTDIQNSYVSGLSLPPASRTASANGSGVNMGESDNPTTAVLMAGAIAGGGPLIDVKVQESKNDNTADAQGAAEAYADVTGATFTQLVGTDDNVQRLLTFFNRSRAYVRAVMTQTGSATANIIGVGFIGPSKSY